MPCIGIQLVALTFLAGLVDGHVLRILSWKPHLVAYELSLDRHLHNLQIISDTIIILIHTICSYQASMKGLVM